jgi:hypothetical protein
MSCMALAQDSFQPFQIKYLPSTLVRVAKTSFGKRCIGFASANSRCAGCCGALSQQSERHVVMMLKGTSHQLFTGGGTRGVKILAQI